MSTKYEFSIINDSLNSAVNIGALGSEIKASDITIALDYINKSGDDCDVWFKADLSSAEETTLSGILAVHTGVALEAIEPPTMDDGRPLVRSDTRPLDTATYFSCRGDTASGIGVGTPIIWDFSNDSEYTTVSGPATLSCGHTVPEGMKAQIIDLTFIDDVYFKDGALYFFDAPWGSYAHMTIVVPAGGYYPNEHGAIPAAALGQPGNGMYSYAATDTPYYRYVNHHFMYGSVPMGDELNAEGAMVHALPPGWKVRAAVFTLSSDTTSKGFASFEMYRHRTVIVEGDSP